MQKTPPQPPIPRKHPNKKFILYGTGPSLTEEVIETIRPYKNNYINFGINDSYKIIDFLDEHYACDNLWWAKWGKDIQKKFPRLSKWAYQTPGDSYGATLVYGEFNRGLSKNPNLIHFGMNSGYQALNLAYLMGGSSFILVGYNMQIVKNKKHYFGDHPEGLRNNSPYPAFIEWYKTIQPEICKSVINCTENSAIKNFPRNNLKTQLEKDQEELHEIEFQNRYNFIPTRA